MLFYVLHKSVYILQIRSSLFKRLKIKGWIAKIDFDIAKSGTPKVWGPPPPKMQFILVSRLTLSTNRFNFKCRRFTITVTGQAIIRMVGQCRTLRILNRACLAIQKESKGFLLLQRMRAISNAASITQFYLNVRCVRCAGVVRSIFIYFEAEMRKKIKKTELFPNLADMNWGLRAEVGIVFIYHVRSAFSASLSGNADHDRDPNVDLPVFGC